MAFFGTPNPVNANNSSINAGINPAAGVSVNSQSGASYNGPFASSSFLGQPFSLFLGLILLLVVFHFLVKHDKLPFEPADLHIGPYNILAVTTTAIVGIVTLKVLANRFPVPGLTELANFI